jgi:putative DNA primase/helicase
VADRSIPIRLKRAQRGKVERFRRRDVVSEAADIAARISAWAESSLERLHDARPAIPPELSDRQADACESLLAIADLAGGVWPKAARDALINLCVGAQAQDESVGFRLLTDIRGIFFSVDGDNEPLQFLVEISSTDLVEQLVKVETSPWSEWSKGKPLSPARPARLLKPFEIYPGQIENGKARGYKLSQFEDAFSRYLAKTPYESVEVSVTQYSCGSDADFKVSDEPVSDTFENASSPNNHAGSRHFDTLKPGIREAGPKQQPLTAEDREVL